MTPAGSLGGQRLQAAELLREALDHRVDLGFPALPVGDQGAEAAVALGDDPIVDHEAGLC